MATIPVFVTYAAGAILPAGTLNSQIRDAGNFFLSWPVCEARQTISQSFTTAVISALLFDTNDVDTDGAHSTVTNTSRYTGKTQGRFQFNGGWSIASNATQRRLLQWAKNGSAVNAGQASVQPLNGNTTEQVARPTTIVLNGTTDYVELNALQESGGTLATTVAGAAQPNMSVRMVGTT